MKNQVYYYDKNRKKYKGRNRICKDCGKQEIKRLINKSIYCRPCSQRHKKTGIQEGELFVYRKGGTERARAKLEKCSNCGKERIVRMDSKYKTNFCRSCLATERGKVYGKIYGPLSKIDGRSAYRKKAFKYFKKECAFCGSIKNTEIHHIDLNRKNNDILNLIPLCNSCHKSVHWRIRKGLTNDKAIEAVKAKKM